MVAFQGNVGAHVSNFPCSMEEQASLNVKNDQSMALNDCCEDVGGVSKMGKTCKVEARCNNSFSYIVLSFQSLQPILLPLTYMVVVNSLPPSLDFFNIWRPPSFPADSQLYS
jgi:hypothetical protein